MASGHFDPAQLEFTAAAYLTAQRSALRALEDETAFLHVEFALAGRAVAGRADWFDLERGPLGSRSTTHYIKREVQRVRFDAGEGADAQHDPVDPTGMLLGRVAQHNLERGLHDADLVHNRTGKPAQCAASSANHGLLKSYAYLAKKCGSPFR
jgi:hypothetical protein